MDLPMTTMVRRGVPADAEPMMILLREMHAENGLAPLDEQKVRNTLMRGLTGDGAIVGIIRSDGIIAASVGLFISRWWYSEASHVEDLWSFVSENYRKSEYAKNLLVWSKHAAKVLGQPLLMGVLSSERTQAKIKLYQRQLGAPVGALFSVGVPLVVA
jgi:hypothetical protein